jgi:isohexenylglutaconyl-CoA hydratase
MSDTLLGRLKKPTPQTVAATKRLLAQISPPADLRDAAARAFAASLRGSEAPEGLAAFAQKRRARWVE